ncbi:SDR family NAD(P)-dependent oxidoreductase [Aquihabitans sp. G128]|uniref:SDR family NAD(P)-dependent oxidoreductase n=1 Tax=Aquihabitans sp. G128 TaxID=2849779 RepID=UPI001C23BBD5|nr:SDR family NAD(P)-dependent oxidoreductase [Aquihabitans sp. G128]QXC59605.1 SDR family NAD(P)-dependent oxidoreductase [Aquihabitans sp. G128]
MTDRSSQTVLTTGANSGIGLATVVELARQGFRSVGSVRSDAKAEVVHAAAADAGVEVHTVLLDVTDAEQCERVIQGLPPLFGLVNNAGYAVTGAIEDVGDDEAHRLFETMVHAPMRLARLALPGLRDGGGRIVNISSIAGLATAPFAGHYTGAKHALEALSDALRMEVAGDGVKVVLVEPGGFKTGIWEEFERDIATREQDGTRHADAYRRSLQLQRLMEPIMGSPDGCARVVATALTTSFPRNRYLVGIDAQAMLLAQRFTPTFLKDRVIRLGLGL